ncbi:MAG: DUF4365 domain-containing protein [Terriglobia bacterium]
MPLRRPPTAQLEEESRLAVEAIVNEMNCQFRRLTPDNSGIDGEIELSQGQLLTGKSLKCQIKAGPGYLSSETEDHLTVRVEKRYLEHWAAMNIPVLLFYYAPLSRTIYWKSIQDYLRVDQSLLKKLQKTVSVPFEKRKDVFSAGVLPDLWLVADGKFSYTKIMYYDCYTEEVAFNWFPVISLPTQVYFASTVYRDTENIKGQLRSLYAFTIRDKQLYTFSQLSEAKVELAQFCDRTNMRTSGWDEVESTLFVELLNQVVRFNLGLSGLLLSGERYYFSSALLRNPSENQFSYTGLRGQSEERVKIYVSGNERKHHAVKLSFHRIGSSWFFEIEPTWFFTYQSSVRKTRKELGARITSELAGTQNKDYVYLLHFWRQFISNNSQRIVFACDQTGSPQEVIIDSRWLSCSVPFRLVNDYDGGAPGVSQP